ncbi:MAG: helix-turn-helix domain-containing protein [Candidatus Contendobacter sp.]
MLDNKLVINTLKGLISWFVSGLASEPSSDRRRITGQSRGEWLPILPMNMNGMTRLEQIERAEIERLLECQQGNLNLVARELEISRTTLWRRLKDYRVQSDKDPDVSE